MALGMAPDTLDYIDRTVEPLYPAPVLDLIRRQKNLVLVPTLGVRYRADVYTRNPELLEQPGLFPFLTPPERAFVLANARKGGLDLVGARSLAVVRRVSSRGAHRRHRDRRASPRPDRCRTSRHGRSRRHRPLSR